MKQTELLSLVECVSEQHQADTFVSCFLHGVINDLVSILAGLKKAVCDCCLSWNSGETKVLALELRVLCSAASALQLTFPVFCNFRNLCSQLHYNFLAKKYKTLLKFNHVNSYVKSFFGCTNILYSSFEFFEIVEW